jgi:CHASE2 domain-containing sensor protein
MNWYKLAAFRQKHQVALRIAMSVFVGLILELAALIMPFPALKATRHSADDMADFVMRKSVQAQATSLAPHFVLITIDDATWTTWGAPLITPRDKIALLLARVAESNPAIIVLDVDLAFRDDTNSEAVLKKFLSDYPKTAPPLILTRSFAPAATAIHSQPRSTQYEEETKHDNVHWAVPSFERDEDGTVRRWQLATVVCNDGAPKIIPSIQLQTAWLWRGKSDADLQEKLAGLRPENCDVPVPNAHVKIPMDGDDRFIEINSEDPSSRIIYSIPWVSNAVIQGPKMADGNFKVVVRNADTVSRIQPGEGIPGIAGSIAVIGGSFEDSGDWYKSPLGQMPGAIILINSIDALAQHGTLKEPSAAQQFAFSLAFIILVSTLVGLFRARVAASLSLIAIAALSLITVPMFRSGVMFNVAIPSLGILVTDFVLSIWDEIEVIKQTGWRWIWRTPKVPAKDHEETK